MRIISVCSGIGTDAVAWHSLGWQHLCFAEIEKFPSAVLAYRWPGIVNEGDFTKIGDKYRGAADLLVGGTPCQSFSVAGLRGGLADDRGNLALEFLRLADRTWPRWVVWENVPGVLSSNEGRDFGTFLGALGQLGYGWAYRVLDAQHFGVPQRRRRVFVVGHLGDWRRAAAVLFERHSLQGNNPPRREKGERVAGTVKGGSGTRGYPDPSDGNGGGLIDVCGAVSSRWAKGTGGPAGDECYNLATHSLRADGFDASEDGRGRGTPIIPILEAGARTGKSTDDIRAGIGIGEEGDPMFTLQSGKQHAVAFRTAGDGAVFEEGDQTAPLTTQTDPSAHVVAIGAFKPNQGAKAQGIGWSEDVAPTCEAAQGGNNKPALLHGMAVRRLTPRECERLQGLPDDHTLIPYNGKPAADGPRYKAIGNGMAVPVVRWIGERISLISKIGTPPKGDYL
jgi:DNA (cytosine-5)-methyltransferase 1